VFPPSGSVLSGLPRTFVWSELPRSAGHFDQVRVEVCADLACAMMLARADAPAVGAPGAAPARGTVTLGSALPARARFFWRVRSGLRGAFSPPGAAMTFSVRRPAAAVHGLSLLQGLRMDLNGDAVTDTAVGMPGAGAVQVFLGLPSGAGGGLMRSFTVTAEALRLTAPGFGRVVRPAGDLNGDGRAELLVGAEEAAYVLRMVGDASAPTLEVQHTLGGVPRGRGFGQPFAPVGDLNEDGFGDALVGAPLDPSATPNSGAYGYYGRGADGALAFNFFLDRGGVNFGAALAGLGDFFGNGAGAMAVSTAGRSNTVRLYRASATGITGLSMPPSAGANPGFGAALAGVGDFNGDGYPELLVGAPENVIGKGRGQAWMLYGTPSPERTTYLPLVTPETASAAFGEVAGAAGDLDNDGYADVVVGEHGGELTVYFGAPTGGRVRTLAINTAEVMVGQTLLGTPCDLDQDGFDEFPVGSTEGTTVWLVGLDAARRSLVALRTPRVRLAGTPVAWAAPTTPPRWAARRWARR
jgi:hypothetical protein